MSDELKKIRSEVQNPSEKPDDKTALEESDFRRQGENYRTNLYLVHIDILKKELKQRDEYSNRILELCKSWLLFVAFIIIVSGLSLSWSPFEFSFDLPENVLIAIIAGTTGSVIASAAIVIKWVFRNNASSISPISSIEK